MPTRGPMPALLLVLLGCSGTDASRECADSSARACVQRDAGTPDGSLPDAGSPPDGTFIVDPGWLKENLAHPLVQPIDTRSSGYDASRIPGAIHIVPGNLAMTVDGVGGQVAPAVDAQPVLRAAGLRNEATAVVYGRNPEYDPARIVWALRYYGHQDVRYLDGGFDAWVDAGGEVDSAPPSVASTDYTIVEVDQELRVEGDWVLAQLGEPPFEMATIQLVDARSMGEYASGHIPTARSVDWSNNLDNGVLRPDDELALLYEGLDPSATTVTYCSTGLRGSFAWLTLVALGYQDVRLYDGSWNEWGHGSFPVE